MNNSVDIAVDEDLLVLLPHIAFSSTVQTNHYQIRRTKLYLYKYNNEQINK